MKDRILFRHKVFEKISPLDYWRFIIDVKIQKNVAEELGWLAYERREPGSVKALLKTYAFMLESIGKKVTPDYIKELHKHALNTVYLSERNRRDIPVGEFRKVPVLFGITRGHNASDAGMDQIYYGKPSAVKFTLKSGPGEDDGFPDKEAKSYLIQPLTYGNKEITSAIQAILTTYYEKLAQISEKKLSEQENTEAIIKIILECVRNLEFTHPFSDGNCRVFCITLFHQLMLENGFPPPILFDPNRIEGYTIEELIKETQEGIKFYHHLPETKPTTKEIIQEQIKQWEEKKYDAVSPLNLAVSIGIPEVVEEMVKHVKKINDKDRYGKTALMLAAAKGDIEIIEMLLKHPDINVNEQDQFGYTAAMWAAEAGFTKAAKLLLNYEKADKKITSLFGTTTESILNQKNSVESKATIIHSDTSALQTLFSLCKELKSSTERVIQISTQDLSYVQKDLVNELNKIFENYSLENINLQMCLFVYTALKQLPGPFVAQGVILQDLKLKIASYDLKTTSVMSRISYGALKSIGSEFLEDLPNAKELQKFIHDSMLAKEFFADSFPTVYRFSSNMVEKGIFKSREEARQFVKSKPEIIERINSGSLFGSIDSFVEDLMRNELFESKDQAKQFILERPHLLRQCMQPSVLSDAFRNQPLVVQQKLLDSAIEYNYLARAGDYDFNSLLSIFKDDPISLNKLNKFRSDSDKLKGTEVETGNITLDSKTNEIIENDNGKLKGTEVKTGNIPLDSKANKILENDDSKLKGIEVKTGNIPLDSKTNKILENDDSKLKKPDIKIPSISSESKMDYKEDPNFASHSFRFFGDAQEPTNPTPRPSRYVRRSRR